MALVAASVTGVAITSFVVTKKLLAWREEIAQRRNEREKLRALRLRLEKFNRSSGKLKKYQKEEKKRMEKTKKEEEKKKKKWLKKKLKKQSKKLKKAMKEFKKDWVQKHEAELEEKWAKKHEKPSKSASNESLSEDEYDEKPVTEETRELKDLIKLLQAQKIKGNDMEKQNFSKDKDKGKGKKRDDFEDTLAKLRNSTLPSNLPSSDLFYIAVIVIFTLIALFNAANQNAKPLEPRPAETVYQCTTEAQPSSSSSDSCPPPKVNTTSKLTPASESSNQRCVAER